MSKIRILFFILIFALAGTLVYWHFVSQKNVAPKVTDFASCLTAGYPVLESYPRQCVADSQTFVEDIGNQLAQEDKIKVTQPRAGETISSPLIIKGEARGFWFFEASFPVKLIDANGQILGAGVAQAQGDWMTEDFVPFQAELKYVSSEAGHGRLILMRDNPSGLPANDDSLAIPVAYLANAEKMKVKVYFQNAELDAATDYDCGKVIAVEREIVKTEAVARAALEELLQGPTATEKDLGFTTTLNAGIKIQKLTIENGVAKVDFDEQLEKGVGGSCWVMAIRAQINETLKQFTTIKSVIISIDGRTEDILQP
jgi:hypothetical protein